MKIINRQSENAEKKKRYGFWVYSDLMDKGLYSLDVLIVSYLIHTKKYSPKYNVTNSYLMNTFHIKEDTLKTVFNRLLKIGIMVEDKDGEIYLSEEKINEILGFSVFENISKKKYDNPKDFDL